MVGLTFSTVLTCEQLVEQCGKGFDDVVKPGSRLACSDEVIETLRKAGKESGADELRTILPNIFDMYVFPGYCYVLKED